MVDSNKGGTDAGKNISGSIHWMERVIDQEMMKLRREMVTLANDLGELLNIHAVQALEPQYLRRSRLAATAVAVGAASVVVGGIAVGSSFVCALKRILGGCNGQLLKNLCGQLIIYETTYGNYTAYIRKRIRNSSSSRPNRKN